MLRAVRIASLVLLAAILSRGAVSQPPQAVPGFNEGGSSAVALRPGEKFSEDGITIQVPPRGMSVTAEAIGSSGKARELALETRRDGSVVVHRGEQAEKVAMVGGTSSACGDGAYTLAGARWAKTYVWYASANNLPSNMSFRGAEGAFKRAISHIVSAYNNCGRQDSVGATAVYAGKTTSSPDISERGACLSADGKNEAGFKRMSSSYLAYSCRWRNADNQIVESDTAYNTYYKWYASATKPSGCYWRWSVEVVATHELGHTFGLSHVTESSHPRLTMSTAIYPCQQSEATLGLGDVRGLEALY